MARGSEVCEHCSNSVRPGDAVSRNGYSYHKKCHKCYVCSETNLQEAEVFRGVIFCASCAKRIFKGCASARTAKTPALRPRRRRAQRSVIARARAAHSSDSSRSLHQSRDTATTRDVSHDCYCVSDIVTQARRLINYIYYQSQNSVKTDTLEADSPEACQQVLKTVKMLPESKTHVAPASQPRHTKTSSMKSSPISDMAASRTSPKAKRRKIKIKKDVPCSDLRIAELGASTEIATMALRKTSTKKVRSESKVAEKPVDLQTISMFSNTDSALSHTSNEEYLDSECHEYRGSKNFSRGILDHTVASILKMPYKYFKKKIIERSSLISVIVGVGDDKESPYERIKTLFHEEVFDHHREGYKKLYSTINKKNMPYKLGWVKPDQHGDRKSSPCRHYHECHGYRCMRKQAMRLAGPTKSKMGCFRTSVKKYIVPQFLRNLSAQHGHTGIVTTACGKSTSFVTKLDVGKLSK